MAWLFLRSISNKAWSEESLPPTESAQASGVLEGSLPSTHGDNSLKLGGTGRMRGQAACYVKNHKNNERRKFTDAIMIVGTK